MFTQPPVVGYTTNTADTIPQVFIFILFGAFYLQIQLQTTSNSQPHTPGADTLQLNHLAPCQY